MGRVLSSRRHRGPGGGVRQALAGAGRHGPAQHEGRSHPNARRRRLRTSGGERLERRVRCGRVERRRRPDLSKAAEGRAQGATRPAPVSRESASACRCSWSISGPGASTRSSRTTASCSDRVIGSSSTDIFERGTLADDFSLYLHAPERHGSIAGAARVAKGSTCLRLCPTLGKRPSTGNARGHATAIGSSITSTSATSPASGEPRDHADLHAGGLRDRARLSSRLGVLARADPDSERLVRRVHNRDPKIKGPLFRRRRHPPRSGRARASSSSAKATAGLMIDDLGLRGGGQV